MLNKAVQKCLKRGCQHPLNKFEILWQVTHNLFSLLLYIYCYISWDKLKVWQNLLDSDYEIYMVRLLVATVNWHKSLQFVKKSNITLLPCLFIIIFISHFDYYITSGYYFLTGAHWGFALCFPLPHLSHKLVVK